MKEEWNGGWIREGNGQGKTVTESGRGKEQGRDNNLATSLADESGVYYLLEQTGLALHHPVAIARG